MVAFNSITDFSSILLKEVVTFGILAGLLGLIFFTAGLKSRFWRKFYAIVPSLLLAYMLPAVLTSLGIIHLKWTVEVNGSPVVYKSQLYWVASRLFLPASLILFTMSIDLKAILRLGWKALLMFFTGTAGIIIGAPLALMLTAWLFPSLLEPAGSDATWRGLSTIAGSWIGGGANQTAMLEIFGFNKELFGNMLLVDIVVANIWMAVLLLGVNFKDKIDAWLRADTSAIEELKAKVEKFDKEIQHIPTLREYMLILGIVFFTVAMALWASGSVASLMRTWFPAVASSRSAFSSLGSSFFWLITLATLAGILLSFTPVKLLEGAGASKIGSVFIYFLVATIGMKINLSAILDHPELFLLGLIWMSIHALLLILVAKWSRSPYFFMAVGSQANVGGAASAPIVAAAFHPALASVGALLAILGYVVGTYGALLAAQLMQWVTEWLR